jgi:hypothetical protein
MLCNRGQFKNSMRASFLRSQDTCQMDSVHCEVHGQVSESNSVSKVFCFC